MIDSPQAVGGFMRQALPKLKSGLSLNAATGVISGTPTVAGISKFTVTVQDSNTIGKKSATKDFTINIAGTGALQIINTSLQNGVNGVAYSATVQAVGGTAPYIWSTIGSLPIGVTLNNTTGEIAGTPIQQGVFNITVKVTDSANPANTGTQDLKLTITKDAAE